MVGVPGRSKGCNTCIQRKVKCAGGAPPCANCRTANRLCTGYRRPVAFVLSSDVVLATPAAAEPSGLTVTMQGRWRRRPRTLPGVLPGGVLDKKQAARTADHGALIRTTTTTTARHATLETPPLLHMAPTSAWRQHLFALYLDLHLPLELQTPTAIRRRPPRNWLMHLPSVSLEGPGAPALEAAMSALCMARVGRQAGDAGVALVQHSLILYTRSLTHLRHAMATATGRTADLTLAACVALSLYELAECPGGQAEDFAAHQDGALALLQERGAAAHSGPLPHALFVFLRVQSFVYAIYLRRRIFFDTPEWLRDPWRTASKDPHDWFMDQMYAVPGLLEETDKLDAETDDTPAAQTRRAAGYADLLTRYVALDARLAKWYVAFVGLVAGPLYAPQLSQLPCPPALLDRPDRPGGAHPFPVAFHFPAFFVGQAAILHWLIQMVVHTQMVKLRERMATLTDPLSDPSSPSPESLSSMEISRTAATNICQSIEYFLQPSTGDIGPLSMLLPLTSVRHNLVRADPVRPSQSGSPGRPGEHSDEVVWLDYLIHLVGYRGHRMALFLD